MQAGNGVPETGGATVLSRTPCAGRKNACLAALTHTKPHELSIKKSKANPPIKTSNPSSKQKQPQVQQPPMFKNLMSPVEGLDVRSHIRKMAQRDPPTHWGPAIPQNIVVIVVLIIPHKGTPVFGKPMWAVSNNSGLWDLGLRVFSLGFRVGAQVLVIQYPINLILHPSKLISFNVLSIQTQKHFEHFSFVSYALKTAL